MNNHPTLKQAAMPALVLALSSLLLIGCGGNKGKDQEVVASLPDLPQADVAKLRAVPHTHLLATSEVQRAPSPPPVNGPPPPCPKDWSTAYFDAEVKYPITVCRLNVADPGDLAGIFIERGPTNKLDNSKLPPDLQATSASQPQTTGRLNVFWTCRTERGPWQGQLTSDRDCVGSCSPLNSLVLTNAPNTVTWQWFGRIDQHPSDFEFAGPLVSQGVDDFGSCPH